MIRIYFKLFMIPDNASDPIIIRSDIYDNNRSKNSQQRLPIGIGW